ncbi:MAG: hypothetical protein GY830_07245 [Bacteroidetes bacterium]|nr:hypothetical protein [Bacteroidota bacterium]
MQKIFEKTEEREASGVDEKSINKDTSQDEMMEDSPYSSNKIRAKVLTKDISINDERHPLNNIGPETFFYINDQEFLEGIGEAAVERFNKFISKTKKRFKNYMSQCESNLKEIYSEEWVLDPISMQYIPKSWTEVNLGEKAINYFKEFIKDSEANLEKLYSEEWILDPITGMYGPKSIMQSDFDPIDSIIKSGKNIGKSLKGGYHKFMNASKRERGKMFFNTSFDLSKEALKFYLINKGLNKGFSLLKQTKNLSNTIQKVSKSQAEKVAEAINGKISKTIKSADGKIKGYIIEYCNKNIPNKVRLMNSGSGKSNSAYYRITKSGKGALDETGKFCSDQAKTHFDINPDSLIKDIQRRRCKSLAYL